ncbi:MAG: DUF885 domain-containing protein [Halobacteria archaeon]|nr:DUF885 domain-containing protein [Halobacteria archaeon]
MEDDEEVKEVLSDYYDGVLERNPHVATVLGVHEHDTEVPSGTPGSVEDEIDEAKRVRDELADLDSYEANLAAASLEYDIFELDELRIWESNPQAVDGVVSLIYPLYVREFAPLDRRLELIAERLEDCPAYVDELRERVSRPVEIWVESEIASCDEIPGLLQLIADQAGDLERQDVSYRINDAAEELLDAFEEYRDWLESLEDEVDSGTAWRVGRERFENLLEKRRLPSGDEVVELAEEEIEDAESRMSRAIASVEAEEEVTDPREAIEAVEDDHPDSFDSVLDSYAHEIRAARDRTDAVVPIPENGDVPPDAFEVAATPEHVAPLLPFAGYFEPSPFADEPARYFITEPEGTGPEALREHNYAEIKETAVSEFYPGHHLQKVYECERASRTEVLSGAFNSFGDDFVEGWKGYALETVTEKGYGGDYLELVRAKEDLASACRAVVDVRLQRGEMTLRDAAEYLSDELGLEPEHALAEVRSYTESPGYQLSRLVGSKLLSGLREDALEEGYDEKEFHEEVLGGGGVPVGFHRRRVLGDAY